MKVLPPLTITDAALTSSSVAEDDYAAWSSGTTYAAGARVIKTTTHRIYESVAAANIAHDPEDGDEGWWIDAGATNRWAMFDEAVGSATGAIGSIVVIIAPGVAADALALLDTSAASGRVEVSIGGSTAYDETVMGAAGRASMLFENLPSDVGATVTVTLLASSPSDPVEVGTLAIGTMVPLGLTEAGPSVGITDFSRRETDDFGNTTVTERGWAKRMAIRSLIDTDDVDLVQARLASVRARPCVWIGDQGFDSLTIYGFFKDFSIDLAFELQSYCTLTIEGLTKAPPLAAATVDWSAITGAGKPADNATVGAPDGTSVGGGAVSTDEDGYTHIDNLMVDRIKAGTGNSAQFATTSATSVVTGTGMGGGSDIHILLTRTVELLAPGIIQATAALAAGYTGSVTDFNVSLIIDGTSVFSTGGAATPISLALAGSNILPAGTYDVYVGFEGPTTMSIVSRNLTTIIIYA